MRTTRVLLQQHKGWMFRRHWKIQGTRRIIDNGALRILKREGLKVENAFEVASIFPTAERVNTKDPLLSVPSAVELISHLAFTDSNVLVAGENQAKVFTNSIGMNPDSLNFVNVESDFTRHDLVKSCLGSSLLYDAYQEKLPKRKDPEREAWNFPRDFGITDRRRNLLLCNRLIQLCSSLTPQLLSHRRTLSDAAFTVPVDRDGEKVMLSLRADILLTSNEVLEPPSSSIDTEGNKLDKDLPVIHPVLSTLSLQKDTTPVADFIDKFPFSGEGFTKTHAHTAIVHFNSTETANLHDCEVSRDQFLSRSLMKAYTFALAEARRRYGRDTSEMPSPVTVQCVHTDGKDFHFSVLQLNTMLDSQQTKERNFYWSLPVQTLYETCDYVSGKPTLKGYNPSVFNTLLAFCCNS